MRDTHVALQNKALQASIAQLLNTYKNIEGSYSSTLIGGCAHFMLDSGIFSDAWSVADMHKVGERVGFECDIDDTDDDALNAWYEAVHDMDDLDCNKLLNAVYMLEQQYTDGAKDSTGCAYLADDIMRELDEQEQAL